MKNVSPALLIATLLLAGCADSGSQNDSASSSTWWNPVSWSWSSLSPTHWFGSSLKVTGQGVGGINGGTALQEEALNKALDGNYTLRSGMRMDKGSVISFWQAVNDEKQVSLLISGQSTVSRIEVMDEAIETDSGVKIGTRFSELYSKAYGACENGNEPGKASVVCKAPDSQNILYVFTGEWHGPEGLMPADETLKNWTLSKIIWQRQAY